MSGSVLEQFHLLTTAVEGRSQKLKVIFHSHRANKRLKESYSL